MTNNIFGGGESKDLHPKDRVKINKSDSFLITFSDFLLFFKHDILINLNQQ